MCQPCNLSINGKENVNSPFVEGTSSRPVRETASLMASAKALNADSELEMKRESGKQKRVYEAEKKKSGKERLTDGDRCLHGGSQRGA